MNSLMNSLLATAAAAALAAAAAAFAPTTAQSAPPEDTTRVKIATSSHRENGCSESAASFKVVIPNHEQLDRNWKGAGSVLGGIEFRITERNGTASYGNVAFADGGSALVYSLPARGGGTRIRVFTANVCQGASGANITIEVYGYYKPSNT
jgi:hypothetical protein